MPVVAASTGHALAAGALMLLGCDVRIGADIPAKVGLNEVAIKMVLPDWALTIAGARLSKRHMQRAIVNARITSPADAVDVGFLDDVVPVDELLDRAVATAAELAATLDPKAYTGTEAERQKLRKDWVGPWGDRRQELVFIGRSLAPEKLQQILDDCLLDDAELALGVDGWKATVGDALLGIHPADPAPALP